ncbi:toast rack family protein [Aliikangiella sp. IMCC44653]
MKNQVGLFAVALLSFGVIAGSLDYQETKSLKLSADDLKSFRIKAGAGSLTVTGDASLKEIEVVAELNVEKDNYELTLKRDGSEALLVADANLDDSSNWFGNSDSPYIHLNVKVPANLKLNIKDGSGWMKVADMMADLEIRDGSGSIEIDSINGQLKVKDGSGAMEIVGVSGSVNIDDGSGSISVKNIGDTVTIEDGSGSIEVTNVSDRVFIEDGSGSLLVQDISGHVTIDDGSGDIKVRRLEQGLTIENSGSGGVSIKDVKGDVVQD